MPDDQMTMTMTVGGVTTAPFTMNDVKEATAAIKGGRVPMKETAADKTTADRASNSAGEEIRQFIERYEHLEAEKKDIADATKEIFAEAKGRGYSVKALRQIIALRKRDADDVAEEEAVLDLYKAALGMA